MNAQLKLVKLGDIRPNPFRALEDWPTVREKVDELKASLEKTGYWEGYMLVRPVGTEYEQAFGHHRIVAAKELWGDDATITVTSRDISDDEMLTMMAQENSETYGQRFYYAVMQPVAAVVKAYAEGRVELEKPAVELGRRGSQDLRSAPSFVCSTSPATDRTYTATTVARYLGWTRRHNDTHIAADRVLTALSALELIEAGRIDKKELVGLKHGDVANLIKIRRGIKKAVEEAVGKDISIQTEVKTRAEKAGDTRTAKRAAEKIETLQKSVAKESEKRADKALKDAAVALNSSSDTALEAAVEAAGFTLGEIVKPRAKTNTPQQIAEKYLTAVRNFFREDSKQWPVVKQWAQSNKKFAAALAEQIQHCTERGRNRKKEIER